MTVDGLRFDPPPECPTRESCPREEGDCDLSCVWPGEQEPLTWQGD